MIIYFVISSHCKRVHYLKLQFKAVRGSRLVRSSPDRAVWVRALAGDIVLCFWARNLTLTVLLSTQKYKWVLANLVLELTL